MSIRRSVKVALVAALSLFLSGCIAPYQPQIIEGTEVRVGWSELPNDYNPQTGSGASQINQIISYLTNSSFGYFGPDSSFVENQRFGKVTKTSDEPLTVEYEIADSVVWSDGVPVDSADLLLSWVATFGYFTTEDKTFFSHKDSNPGLASILPVLEGKKFRFSYDQPTSDWRHILRLGVAVHGVVQMAYPELEAAEAKSQFVAAVTQGDLKWLAPVAEKWNTGYQTATTPDALQALSAGAYVVEEVIPEVSVTLMANPRYEWGPAPRFEKIILKRYQSPEEMVAAISAGDLDLGAGIPNQTILEQISQDQNLVTSSGTLNSYEHLDLTMNNGGPFDSQSYAGDISKALAVRKAFLLTVPREEILKNLVAPYGSNYQLRNSLFFKTASKNLEGYLAENGSAEFISQELSVRLEEAKHLLSEAGVTTPIEVGFWYPEGNVRRGQIFEFVAASAALAGFQVVDESEPDWIFVGSDRNPHDVVLYANPEPDFGLNSYQNYFSTNGTNSFSGYSNPEVDALLALISVEPDGNSYRELSLELERLIWADAYTLPLFESPQLLFWSGELEGPSPNPNFPGLFWNFWDWKPTQAN